MSNPDYPLGNGLAISRDGLDLFWLSGNGQARRIMDVDDEINLTTQLTDQSGLIAGKADAAYVAAFAAGFGISLTETVDASGNRLLTWTYNGNGRADGSSPSTGQVGEDASVSISQGSAVALTTNVAANILSATLQPGTWDVGGAAVGITGTATSVTSVCAGISTTSATAPALLNRAQWLGRGAGMSAGDSIMVYPSQRFTVPAGNLQTVYLTGLGIFTGGTLSVYGELRVRRVF